MGGSSSQLRNFAAEIHDTLAQSLAGILAQLQAASQTPDDAEAMRKHLVQAEDSARRTLVEARRTVQAVQPAELEGARLPEAIAALTDRWSQEERVAAALVTTGRPPVGGS